MIVENVALDNGCFADINFSPYDGITVDIENSKGEIVHFTIKNVDGTKNVVIDTNILCAIIDIWDTYNYHVSVIGDSTYTPSYEESFRLGEVIASFKVNKTSSNHIN